MRDFRHLISMEEGIPQPQQQRGLVESLMCWARFKQIEQNQKNNLKPFSRIKVQFKFIYKLLKG